MLQVFEVNSSHRRSGKQVLQQLQEATQSHQVSNKNMADVFSTILSGENISETPRYIYHTLLSITTHCIL